MGTLIKHSDITGIETQITSRLQRLRTLGGGLPDEMIAELVPIVRERYPLMTIEQVWEGCLRVLDMPGYTDSKQVLRALDIVEEEFSRKRLKDMLQSQREARAKDFEREVESPDPEKMRDLEEKLTAKMRVGIPILPRPKQPDELLRQSLIRDWQNNRIAWAKEHKSKINDYPITMETFVAQRWDELVKITK